MTLVQYDRVQETSTTTGTGTYTLAGAVLGYQSFAAVGNGNTCYYCAMGVDGNGNPNGDGWEVGLGTYTAAGTTLARTAVLASTNGGAAVNWAAGTRRIFVTIPAGGAPPFLLTNATGLPLAGLATPPPSTELDYVEFTSNVSPTATTEATADTIVTGSSVAYDGSTVVLIEFFAHNARADTGAAGRTMTFWLYQDGSSIGSIGLVSTPAASASNSIVHAVRRLTPSNASHTYSIRASVSAGTGLVAAGVGGSGAATPGFIRISRK